MPEPNSENPASITWFREELNRLEALVIVGLGLVVSQLDRALDAITFQNVELAAMVTGDDRQIDVCYVEVHQGVLALLARQALFADDLRLAAALLHVVRCVERMGDQCANIAKLVPLSGYDVVNDLDVLELIENMGASVRRQVEGCREAFRTRDARVARVLVEQYVEVNRMDRAVFQGAVDAGDDPGMREWAMFMVLVARCLERIGGNAIDIAEQAVFVKTGVYEDFSAIEDS